MTIDLLTSCIAIASLLLCPRDDECQKNRRRRRSALQCRLAQVRLSHRAQARRAYSNFRSRLLILHANARACVNMLNEAQLQCRVCMYIVVVLVLISHSNNVNCADIHVIIIVTRPLVPGGICAVMLECVNGLCERRATAATSEASAMFASTIIVAFALTTTTTLFLSL